MRLWGSAADLSSSSCAGLKSDSLPSSALDASASARPRGDGVAQIADIDRGADRALARIEIRPDRVKRGRSP